MKKSKVLICSAVAAAIFGCGSKYVKSATNPTDYVLTTLETKELDIKKEHKAVKKTLYETYKDNIFYNDFFKVDFSSLPKAAVSLPSDIEDTLSFYDKYIYNVKDLSSFEKLIWKEAKKLKHDKKSAAALPAKEAIVLAADIVANRYTYFSVDTDKEFLKKHGAFLPIDTYFNIGKGDCDKYADSFVFVFKAIKKVNPNLKNIYVFYRGFGGFSQAHAWNSLIFLREDSMTLSHIDPTAYDDDTKKLEGEKGYHVPKSRLEMLAKVYSAMGNFKTSKNYYEKYLNGLKSTEKKAKALADIAYLGHQLKDKEIIKSARERFMKLGTEKYMPSILYYSHQIEKCCGDKVETTKYKKELLKKFPDSFWSKDLKKK